LDLLTAGVPALQSERQSQPTTAIYFPVSALWRRFN
jgi:hypothetical protein